MSIFRYMFGRSTKPTKTASEARVSRAANSALKKYEKTFTDLARYDRGELVRN